MWKIICFAKWSPVAAAGLHAWHMNLNHDNSVHDMVVAKDMQLLYLQSGTCVFHAKTLLTPFPLMQWITLEFVERVCWKDSILDRNFSYV